MDLWWLLPQRADEGCIKAAKRKLNDLWDPRGYSPNEPGCRLMRNGISHGPSHSKKEAEEVTNSLKVKPNDSQKTVKKEKKKKKNYKNSKKDRRPEKPLE